MTETAFTIASPVWAEGLEKERNVSVVLSAEIKSRNSLLRISAHSVYQAFLNGRLVADGPARAAHGFYRVDEINLTDKLAENDNLLEIIVAGYNIANFYLVNAPSFVCAEIISDDKPVAYTGGIGFDAHFYGDRIKKVHRYSFQRTFAEVYSVPAERKPAKLVPVAEKRFITREVPYPSYDTVRFRNVISTGTFCVNPPDDLDKCRKEYPPYVTGTGLTYSFDLEDLDVFPERELRRLKFEMSELPEPKDTQIVTIGNNSCFIADLLRELTGFIEFSVETTGGRLFVTFDEVLRNGDIDFTRMTTTNGIIYDLAPGKYHLVSFEPYSLRYIKFSSEADKTVISKASLITFEFGGEIKKAPDFGGDETLKRIYDAAVSTFKQNTLDIYMDCPSRERAGWLCDSFFTSRSERALTGKSIVEHAFLDNFIMTDNPYVAHGMLPMCYPSDHEDGTYIPNWAMWYGIELNEYLQRTGDTELICSAKKKMYELVDFLRRFENKDGLLEKLESWVFVEWSHSNDLVQDINYPTNMLYSMFKRSIGQIYSDESLVSEAERLAEKVIRESYREGWFCDNSVYGEDGLAHLTGEITETCQYYAFFTGVATPESFPDLWNKMLSDFGPGRKEHNTHPDIAFSNAFIGNYLRLELLFRNGLYEKLINEIKGYFDYMALKTGTLWENDGDYASCNHGFASHVLVWLRSIYSEKTETE